MADIFMQRHISRIIVPNRGRPKMRGPSQTLMREQENFLMQNVNVDIQIEINFHIDV